jgi:curved DNA-binding protein CbpA
MALGRGDKLEATGKPLDGLPLTPEDFFVFSRIDGTATVAEVIAATGLDGGSAEKILGKLIELGAIRPKDGAPAQPRKRGNTQSRLREQAAARRKQLLADQFKAGKASAAKPKSEKTPEPEPEPEAPSVPATRVRLVDESDVRVDANLAIPVDHQRLVLAINDQLAELSHFDLLGIAPTNDKKEIRRAYHQASRKLHPDTYYGKNLGSYEALLDQLFKRARASYELLNDDARREAYVQRLLAERAKEEAELRKQHASEQAAKDMAAQIEAERKALEEQIRKKEEDDKNAGERKAREERDKKRRKRLSRRISPIEGRQRKARDHFEQGERERDAGRHGAAASFFRLAMDLDPNNSEYDEQWKHSLSSARSSRAIKAFDTAKQYEEMGRLAEAAHYFEEAADANPTPRNLAHTALASREQDPVKAREMALRALDALRAAEQEGDAPSGKEAGAIHAMCGYAFLAAGQTHSAKEQAAAAQVLLGDSDQVKALLASIKAAPK